MCVLGAVAIGLVATVVGHEPESTPVASDASHRSGNTEHGDDSPGSTSDGKSRRPQSTAAPETPTGAAPSSATGHGPGAAPHPQMPGRAGAQDTGSTSSGDPTPYKYFADCDVARAAGAAPLRRGDAGYRPGLDPDNDGIACDN